MSNFGEWKYIVWVGGVDDYYKTYERAKEHYDEWIEQGYDDVIIERLSQKVERHLFAWNPSKA